MSKKKKGGRQSEYVPTFNIHADAGKERVGKKGGGNKSCSIYVDFSKQSRKGEKTQRSSSLLFTLLCSEGKKKSLLPLDPTATCAGARQMEGKKKGEKKSKPAL